jgi:hypothetical protein
MRRLEAVAIAMAVAVLVMAPSALAARRHSAAIARCPAVRSHALVADAQAEVYEAATDPKLPEKRGIVGCAYGKGESYFLGIPPTYGAPDGTAGTIRFTLAGPVVAFEVYSITNDEPTDMRVHEIEVRDLANGRVLHEVPTGESATPQLGDIGVGGASAIVVRGDGAVAWIVEVDEGAGPRPGEPITYQVHAVDKSGSRTLAVGPEIEPDSLALAGSTLYWTEGGKPYSALLQ